MVAVRRNHAASVQALLVGGSEVNRANAAGETPLWWAAYHGRADVADLLLQAKADTAARCQGCTVVEVATRRGHGESLLRVLLPDAYLRVADDAQTTRVASVKTEEEKANRVAAAIELLPQQAMPPTDRSGNVQQDMQPDTSTLAQKTWTSQPNDASIHVQPQDTSFQSTSQPADVSTGSGQRTWTASKNTVQNTIKKTIQKQ